MRQHNFFAELKRRNVYQIAVAYLVVSWLLIQAASIPPEGDALFGPDMLIGLAVIQARTAVHADADAIETLHRQLVMPGGALSVSHLRVEPMWNPIRREAAFLQLLAVKEHIGP